VAWWEGASCFVLLTAEVGSIKLELELELRGWRDTELPPPLPQHIRTLAQCTVLS
jgi:hypothetical protein